jgi:long-chain-fatty-acid--CoA ligase ACSBG
MDDFLHVSSKAYRALTPSDGRNLHWISQTYEEIPIPMMATGYGSEPPMSLVDALLEAASLTPDLVAFKVKRGGEWVSWTYAQYSDQAHCFARGLASLGIAGRKCTNICSFNSPEWVISYLGAIIADCVPIGVYVTSGPDAVKYVAAHSEAEVLVVQNEAILSTYLQVIDSLPKVRAVVVCFPTASLAHLCTSSFKVLSWDEFMSLGSSQFSAEVERRKKLITPGRVATVIYTSGTTGPPKGVLLSHDNFVWTIRVMEAVSGIEPDEECGVSYLPLSHGAAQQSDIVAPLIAKACLYFADDRALQGTLGATLKEVRPTFFLGVPRVYEKIEEKVREVISSSGKLKQKIVAWAQEVGHAATLAKLANKPTPWGYSLAKALVFNKVKQAIGLDRVKTMYVSAAPVSKTTLDFFASLDMPLLNIYGMSESSGPMSTATMTHCNLYSAGFPLPSTTILILDEQGRPVPSGTRGEVCYRGRSKFLGYLKDPDATRAVVDAQGLLHSGDEGYMDDQGYLFITGRFKELIITAGGENIPPVLLEQNIKAQSKLISNVFVVGDGRKYLGALITLKSQLDENGQPSEALAHDLHSFVSELGSSARSIEEATKDPRIFESVDRAVSEANELAASRAQHVRKWAFILGDFTIEGGELTPTAKVRRRVVSEKYKEEIEALYRVSKL